MSWGFSPFKEMEQTLFELIKDHRQHVRKVTSSFMRITAKKLLNSMEHPLKDEFKASNGWMQHFLKCRKIKFCERQSGKQKSSKQQLEEIQKWLGYFSHKVLPLGLHSEVGSLSTRAPLQHG
jgi:hypothetical protein